MARQLLYMCLFSFRELIRSRIYMSLLVAAICCVLLTLVLEIVSAGHAGRMLLDIGLWLSSLISVCIAGILGVHLITQDIASKRIHILIARPIFRSQIILSRFLTIFALILASNLLMGAVLELLLWGIGSPAGFRLLGAALFFSLEGSLIAAVALMLGIGSSGAVSGGVTVFVFVLGRLSSLFGELIEAGKFGDTTRLMELIFYLIPQLHRFDLTRWAAGDEIWNWNSFGASIAYGLFLTIGILAMAAFRLEKKDLY
jgi:Cu-processing system permease protein